MIVDSLTQADRYAALHPGLQQAFDFLRLPVTASLADGRHVIDGDRVFAIVARQTGRGRDAARLEAHRQYLDVQYVVAGQDEMGWRPLEDCRQIESPYDAAKDLMFFADMPRSWILVPTGALAIFFPQDAHAPLAAIDVLHKIVVKVAMSDALPASR